MSLELDLSAKKEKNLRALRTIEANVIDILEDSSHTAVYSFDALNTKWSRLDVEGSLFIVKKSTFPPYSLIVMNKKGPNDFVLDLSTLLNVKIQEIYMMLRCSTGGAPAIYGFWFHDEKERLRVNDMMKRIQNKDSALFDAPNKSSMLLKLLNDGSNSKKETVEVTTTSIKITKNMSTNNKNQKRKDDNSAKLLSLLQSPQKTQNNDLLTDSEIATKLNKSRNNNNSNINESTNQNQLNKKSVKNIPQNNEVSEKLLSLLKKPNNENNKSTRPPEQKQTNAEKQDLLKNLLLNNKPSSQPQPVPIKSYSSGPPADIQTALDYLKMSNESSKNQKISKPFLISPSDLQNLGK